MTETTVEQTEPAPETLREAISAVMRDLPGIGKDGRADAAQGGYAYRGIEQITREVQGLFAKYGVVFLPKVKHVEVRNILVRDKPWTDTQLTIVYKVLGPSHGRLGIDGKRIRDREKIRVVAIGLDNSDKGANKAMTQGFKYALLQALMISDSNDDTDGQTHEADLERTVAKDLRDALRRQIDALTPEAQERVREVWKEAKLPRLDFLTTSSFAEADKIVNAETIRAHEESKAAEGLPEPTDAVRAALGLDPRPAESTEEGPGASEPAATGPEGSPEPTEPPESLEAVSPEHLEGAIRTAGLLPSKAVEDALRQRGLKLTGNLETRRARLARALALEAQAADTEPITAPGTEGGSSDG